MTERDMWTGLGPGRFDQRKHLRHIGRSLKVDLLNIDCIPDVKVK